ncbi:UNVERIFIED_CONTAM: Cytosolic purine 5'-nucleotidase [Sesamum latifolium]|uniref:Cytosolic purine 5'-nucleotidase n=1 Tax=Sesamum latifolium TaxID=2727402 RepID=A0AAW2WCW5_9LAMI
MPPVECLQKQGVSGSIRGLQLVLVLDIPRLTGKWLFNAKMRIAKGRSLSLCVSLFSAPSPSTSSTSFSSRILHFQSRGFSLSISDQVPGRRKVDCSRDSSNNQLYTSNIMDSKTMQFERTSSSEGDKNLCVWSSPEGGRKIHIGKQIFCNRSLNMRNIVAVGFDMDYTLAQYKPETFESLAYEGTVKKLVNDLGYPIELLEWSFDWTYMVRGLVLDKKRGNILKMDRHKYVKVAYHGFRELSKEDKVATYGSTLIRDSFDEPEYALIDTLFSLAEAYLFAQLVDFKDNNPGKIPAEYINEDSSIVPMLKMLRDSGRATFLVTNSLWDYTNIVMNFLCGPREVDGCSALSFDWLKYFDVVITGSAKPSFFHDENRANFSKLILSRVDSSLRLPLKSLDKSCQVFQGGNVGHLHKLLSIESSSQVLYVGDHIYGDILRSKKVLGWRTMLVVPELEKEVELLWTLRDTRKKLQLLRNERDHIEDEIHHLKWYLRFDGVNVVNKEELLAELAKLQSQQEQLRLSHQEAQRECHQKFHKVWGQLLKTGYQNSRFAHQVERFACLYTSQVSNLSLYSPDKYYRPSEDFMPHEFDILAL